MTTTAVADRTQILCEGLVRIYKRKGVEVVALQGLDLHVGSGELVAIVGASGSGKSTLLNILSGLDSPSAGRAVVAGHDLLAMGRSERRQYRLQTCGFVWQRSGDNLVPYLSAAENVDLPQRLAGTGRAERRAAQRGAARPARDRRHRDRVVRPRSPAAQQQRLAVAVALANEPQVLFCDEPTGELDTAESHEVYGALQQVNESQRHHRGRRHPRPGGDRGGAPHGRHPRRPHRVGDAAPYAGRRRRRARHRRRGVRGARPGRPAAAARATSWPRSGCGTGCGSSSPTTTSRSGRRTGPAGGGGVVTDDRRSGDLHKTYRQGGADVHALRGVDLDVAAGQLLALTGRSGAGQVRRCSTSSPGCCAPTPGRSTVDGLDVTGAASRT